MYNIRYHIASLVAVFLALALGLVLGGLVVRQGTFDSQQSAIVSGLQKDFGRLKKQNTALKKDLVFEKQFSAQMSDSWIAERLAGRMVVLITTGAKGEGTDAAASTIRAAGGKVAVVKLTKPNMGLADKTIAEAARSVVGTATDLETAVPSTLASEWSQPGAARPLTEAMVKAGAFSITDLPASVAATQLVDIAAFDRKPDALALDMAQAYAAAGLYALGAEMTTSDTGVAAAAAARKLSAFDTLGTSAGRFTLVALFSGGEQGFYSMESNATPRFPPMPTP